jgi:hypothetical protein
MSPPPARRWRITVTEWHDDGTQHVRLEGNCSAFVLAVCDDRTGDLRVLTDHDGPAQQRRTALTALSEHVRATIRRNR